MKLNNRIALSFALSAALFSVSALTQAQAPATPAAPVAAAAAPAAAASAKATKMPHKAKKAAAGAQDSCLKQKLAVAEYFCSLHADACQAEKDGAAKQCHSEARGERQKG